MGYGMMKRERKKRARRRRDGRRRRAVTHRTAKERNVLWMAE